MIANMDTKCPMVASTLAALACWIGSATPSLSLAQPTPTPDSGSAENSAQSQNQLPQVVVEGQRAALERRLGSFVRGVTSGTRFHGEAFVRWDSPVCFAVAGLNQREGLFVLGRLRDIAKAAGARVGRPNCTYNAYVVFDPNPQPFLGQLYSHRFFTSSRSYALPGEGAQGIQGFLHPKNPEPVRVWHNVVTVGRDGRPLEQDGACATVVVQSVQVPVGCSLDNSRLMFTDVLDLSMSLVIVNTSLAKGSKLGQLADYCAMAALADLNLDADLGDAPTVLRLFSMPPEARPPGLTAWDKSFLYALYHSERGSKAQASQVAVKMHQDIVPAQ